MNLLPDAQQNEEESEEPSEMANTFMGKLPKDVNGQMLHNPELMKQLIGAAVGGGEMDIAGRLSPGIIKGALQTGQQGYQIGKKGMEYINPKTLQNKAEDFRQTLSPAETSSENIENLSKRVQFAKGSGAEQALSPKREIYSQEGKSDIYDVGKENLPEGNLEKFSQMINPGDESSQSQIKALQNALKDYRKGKITDEELKLPETYRKRRGITNFQDKIEDIFGIPELTPAHADKISDILSMPTSRDSKYFADPDVTNAYHAKGNLMELHNKYENNPILNNYDPLQSAMKKEQRKLSKAQEKNYSDSLQPRLDQLNKNIENLNEDSKKFFSTLPENMQNLEKEFRTTWATGPAKYEDAKQTIRRLSKGQASQVTDADIIKTFTKPDEKTKEIIKELGPSVGRNVLYSALVKVKPGDYKNMAESILELKRTKGFDNFVTKDIEHWANTVLKHEKKASLIRKAGSVAGSTAIGGLVGGPVGATVGLVGSLGYPFAKDFTKSISKYVGK